MRKGRELADIDNFTYLDISLRGGGREGQRRGRAEKGGVCIKRAAVDTLTYLDMLILAGEGKGQGMGKGRGA